MDLEGADSHIRDVLDRYQGAGAETHRLRDEILASWQRCALVGLRSNRFEVPYESDLDEDSRLAWAATLVLERVENDLEDTKVGLLLTDQRAQVVDRTSVRARSTRVGSMHLSSRSLMDGR